VLSVEAFGRGPGGAEVRVLELDDGRGMRARVTDLGAALVGLEVPDAAGRPADVVLGFDSAEEYAGEANPHMGATVGRVANRVSGAAFELDGVRYRLTANEPPNHLHGGGAGRLGLLVWRVVAADARSVELACESPAGSEGYPGRLSVRAVYRLGGGALEVAYRAETDAATPVNLTNHAYFNLAGAGEEGSVLGHELRVEADRCTPVGAGMLPTGRVEPVSGPLDLRAARRIGDGVAELAADPVAGGYDHNFVLRGGGGVRTAAVLGDPVSGRVMELQTDQPCLQVYSGNQVARGLAGKGGRVYGPWGSVCLEPQGYPDAPNRPEFPGAVLRPGEVYERTIRYRFGAR